MSGLNLLVLIFGIVCLVIAVMGASYHFQRRFESRMSLVIFAFVLSDICDLFVVVMFSVSSNAKMSSGEPYALWNSIDPAFAIILRFAVMFSSLWAFSVAYRKWRQQETEYSSFVREVALTLRESEPRVENS